MAFEDVITKTVADASAQDNAADAKVQALAAGAQDDLHGTMIAVKEADITVHLVSTIRNKLLDAFQELWKTSV
jgi:flagellar hook-basal body complex protein FliE